MMSQLLRRAHILSRIGLLAVTLVLCSAPAQAQITRFAPEDIRSGDFGFTLDLSSDGTIALVGDVQDDVGGNNNQGSAYLFRQQTDGTYSQVQKLLATEEAEDAFGGVIALSDDGSTAFVRLVTEINFQDTGIVYVFTDDGTGTYVESDKIISGDAPQGFGDALATTANGDLVFIGATNYADGSTGGVGAVYVHERQPDGTYAEIQQILSSSSAFIDFFGAGLAVSDDGQTLLAGAVGDGFGTVFVFERQTSGSYTEQQDFTLTEQPNDYAFGNPIALSANGNTAFIGTEETGSSSQPRKAFVYTRGTSGDFEAGPVFEPNGAQSSRDEFGVAVDVSDDGGHLFAGAPLFNEAYYYYRQSDGSYIQERVLDPGGLDSGGVRFGKSVALRGDGALGLVGVPSSEPTADDTPRGAVYVFSGADLPVELADFRATPDGDAVHLAWQTISETNNTGFAIERAVVDEDEEFARVAFVNGAGTSSTPRAYTFIDTGLPVNATRIQYRLRQVDIDGTSELSDVVNVVRRAEAIWVNELFPNPAKNNARLEYTLPTTATVQVDVYDLLGRHVAEIGSGAQPAGRADILIDTSQWANGVYFVRLLADGQVHTRRLTVVR